MALFDEVIGGRMHLNEAGRTVDACWRWLAEQYPYVHLGAYVVMPNHLHGILILVDDDASRRGGSRAAPTGPIQSASTRKSLGSLIGAFKTVSTRRINALFGTPGSIVWQRNYYDHIIRGEADWQAIREYIDRNPAQWTVDRENPAEGIG
ncbi:MAG: transposase [Anaerolineae bacterium]